MAVTFRALSAWLGFCSFRITVPIPAGNATAVFGWTFGPITWAPIRRLANVNPLDLWIPWLSSVRCETLRTPVPSINPLSKDACSTVDDSTTSACLASTVGVPVFTAVPEELITCRLPPLGGSVTVEMLPWLVDVLPLTAEHP